MEFVGNQKDVIEYGKGTLLVEAGPGSGKTTVIVERIKHLINNEGVKPESFLVITFTNKAADNLKYKLRKELSSEDVLKMQISTIQSVDYYKTTPEIFLERYRCRRCSFGAFTRPLPVYGKDEKIIHSR